MQACSIIKQEICARSLSERKIVTTLLLIWVSIMTFLVWPHRVKYFPASNEEGWKWQCWSLSPVQLFVTPWTVASQAPLQGSLQARILEWVAIPFSRGSFWHRDQTWVSRTASRFFTTWVMKIWCLLHEWGRRQSFPPLNPKFSFDYKNVAPLNPGTQPPFLSTSITHKFPILRNLLAAYHFSFCWISSSETQRTWASVRSQTR